jgi:hypothetical protein
MYFSYIVAVSLNGGGKRSNRRRLHIFRKSDKLTLSHNVVSNTPRKTGFENTTLVMMGTDCIGSCKSNYHAITTTTFPVYYKRSKFPRMKMQ